MLFYTVCNFRIQKLRARETNEHAPAPSLETIAPRRTPGSEELGPRGEVAELCDCKPVCIDVGICKAHGSCGSSYVYEDCCLLKFWFVPHVRNSGPELHSGSKLVYADF